MLTENRLNTNTLKIGALHLAAIASSIASAVVAYPAASHYFGAIAGTVLLAVSALVIYFAWHYFATEQTTDNTSLIKRGIAVGLALFFALAMIMGIHTSAQLPQQQQQQQQQLYQQQLYQQQEQARIELVNKLSDELRVTSKNRNPDQYQHLQNQIAANSQPLPLPSTASATTKTNPDYLWVVSAIFEIVTPSLLLLAGFYSARNSSSPVTIAPTTSQQSETAPDNPSTTPPATSQQQEGTGSNVLEALKNRLIPLNDKGNLVASAIMQVTGCNERNARQALKEAVQQGIVQSFGAGNATYYQYSKLQLRVVG